MKATITTIAEMAGVSRGTVDKVLHNREGVSKEVREKVRRVIDELDYRPNQLTRAPKKTQKPIHLAIIIPPIINPYYADTYKGMQQALSRYRDNGLTATFFHMEDYMPERTVAALEQAKALPIDGVVMQGVLDDSVRELIADYSGRNIPVVLFDSDLEDSKRLCFVGEDHMKSGYITGSLLAKTVGKSGDVALIGGSSRFTGHMLRVKGFEEILKKRYPKVNVVEVVETEENNTIAYNETVNIINKYPELKGIYVVTGCTSGVARAVIDMKKVGEIGIVGHNLTPDVAAMVNLGIVDFAVNLMPSYQGFLTVETIFKYLYEGAAPAKDHIETPLDIAIAENIDSFLNS